MTDKFKKGDRVRVNKSDTSSHGQVGTVKSPAGWAGGVYTINFDDSLVLCRNWSERYLEPAPLEIGQLVQVKGHSEFWDGVKGTIYEINDQWVFIHSIEAYEHFEIGTKLGFHHDQVLIVKPEPAPIPERDVVREALEAAKLVFQQDAQRYFEKGKYKKEEARWVLFDLMQDALNDIK